MQEGPEEYLTIILILLNEVECDNVPFNEG